MGPLSLMRLAGVRENDELPPEIFDDDAPLEFEDEALET